MSRWHKQARGLVRSCPARSAGASAGPAWVSAIDARPDTRDFSFSALPLAADWIEDKAFTEWKPRYIKPDDELLRHYASGAARVGLYLTHYGHGKAVPN